MRNHLIVATFLILTAPAAFAADFDWTEFRAEILAGLGTDNAGSLESLEQRLATMQPEPEPWRHYWQAYVAFRGGLLREFGATAKAAFKRCLEHARAAIELGETSGESLALLGGCHSQLARGGPMAGMRHGGKSSNAADVSLLDAPDNPRVLIFAGIRDLYTPIMFGGDPERAERRLKRALQIMESVNEEDRDPWLPRWGRIDAHGSLALALAKLERDNEAKGVLDEARAAGLKSAWLDSIGAQLSSD